MARRWRSTAPPTPGSTSVLLRHAEEQRAGQLLILDYAPDYSWAIVSDPSLFSGYILSRTQTLPADEYQALVDRARQLGVGPIRETKRYI